MIYEIITSHNILLNLNKNFRANFVQKYIYAVPIKNSTKFTVCNKFRTNLSYISYMEKFQVKF